MPQPPAPREIAPGVYTVDHAVAAGKNAILLGTRAAWAVDTGTYAGEGRVARDFIQAQGYVADKLLYTHGHPDHVLGSRDFRDALVVAHALTPAEMRRLLPTWAARAQRSTTEIAAEIAWPAVTFSHELTLDLENLQVRVFPTPGHSQDGVSLYIEAQRLLIAGDAVVTSIVPAIGDGDSRTLCATLRHLRTLAIDVLVPGHGEVVYGAAQVQDWLRWIENYLNQVRAEVRRGLTDGLDPETLIAQAEYDRLIGTRLPADQFNMRRRHQATVDKIIQEEQASAAR